MVSDDLAHRNTAPSQRFMRQAQMCTRTHTDMPLWRVIKIEAFILIIFPPFSYIGCDTGERNYSTVLVGASLLIKQVLGNLEMLPGPFRLRVGAPSKVKA